MDFPPLTLHLENLACQRGERLLFEGLNASVRSGELLLLTGPNGAGKSSLLRVVSGLLSAPSGSVSLIAESDSGQQEWEVAPACHYLSHKTPLKSTFSVTENLNFWAGFSGTDGLSLTEALEAVGLPHVADLPASVLSAGQSRRVTFARLLMSERPIWLLDEPTAAMDKQADETIGKLVSNHITKGGLVIAATHLPLRVEESVNTKTLELSNFVPENPFARMEELL